MQKSKSRWIGKIVAYVLLLLGVVAIVGVIYRFTNGFHEPFKTFYLEQNGEKILSENSRFTAMAGEEYRFDVKYVFEDEDADMEEYSVDIYPYAQKDFDFVVGDELLSYLHEGDFGPALQLKKDKTFFTISTPKGANFKTILERKYPDKRIEIPQGIEREEEYLFEMVVASYDKTIVYSILLRVAEKTTGVKFERSEVEIVG